MKALAEKLALRRSVVALLGMLVLVGLGEQLFAKFVPVYLAAIAPRDILPYIIGLYGFLDNGLNAVYALPGGYLTDRLGARRSLVIFCGLNLLGYFLMSHEWWPAVLLALLFSSAWSQLSLPATFSLVSEQLPRHKRVMGLAVQGIVRRIPRALGPVVAGMLMLRLGVVPGMKIALLSAGVLTLVAVAVQLALSSPEAPRKDHQELHPLALWRTFRPELKALLASDILIRFCEQIPNAFVAIWAIDHLHRTTSEFGWLTAIEMASAAVLYIPVALWVERVARAQDSLELATERKPFVLATFCIFTAVPVCLYFATGWWTLVFAFMVRGFKEFGEPTRKATIADYAREGLKARTVGLYYTIRDSITACAALAGGFLWKISPGTNLWTAFTFGVIGTLVFALGVGRRPAQA